ncbi:hypothetical protein PO909_012122, partial [Leuciscus waleckii]
PKIQSKDAIGLREFSDFLNACQDAIPHVASLQILNDCDENQKLVQKLPEWAASRWNRQVTQTLRNNKDFPDFKTFAAFVSLEAEIGCNPVTSSYALSLTSVNKQTFRDSKGNKANVLNTQTDLGLNRPKIIKKNVKPPCVFCQDPKHQLYDCSKLMTKTLAERRAYVWSIVGPSLPRLDSSGITSLCHRLSVKEIPSLTPADAIRILESDFKDANDDGKVLSQDDIAFLNKLSDGIKRNSSGHYEMPLPFKARPNLPDNRQLALVRLNHLKRKLLKDQRYKEHYVKFMEEVIYRGEAEEVKDGGSQADRDFLRFLWWRNGDLKEQPREYRMTVHLFGASSSPGCVNYGLKYLAEGNKDQYPLGFQFVMNDFYVDDGVTSVQTTEDAIQLAQEARDLCAIGGLRLHKFVSNYNAVLESIPPSERAINVKEPDLSFDSLTERTLGIQWNMECDCFKFDISLKEQPATRRGILSTIASLYDPQWRYVPTRDNPADHVSGGLTVDEMISSDWFTGPRFLWNKEMVLPANEITELQLGDSEVRCSQTLNTKAVEQETIVNRLSKFSSWSQVIGAIARIQRRIRKDKSNRLSTVEEREKAECLIIKLLQRHVFETELKALSKGIQLSSHNELYNLDPFLDSDGVLKVGGRLRNSSICSLLKHPTIIPKDHHITKMIIADCHERVKHQASHTGGVWERQIKTVRSVLQSTLLIASERIDDSSLRAFFYEAMSIVNSRPLTVNNLSDPNSLEPITPNHFLTMKSTIALPPPGKFTKEDLYARRRWRHVQYLAEQFWSRWRKEYLSNI